MFWLHLLFQLSTCVIVLELHFVCILCVCMCNVCVNKRIHNCILVEVKTFDEYGH